MKKQTVRTSDMSQWSVATHYCQSLADAMAFAQGCLSRTDHVLIWPIKRDRWLVITRWPILAS